MSELPKRTGAVAISTVFASFACIFSEWLFFATKFSFLSFLSWPASLAALLGVSLVLSLAGIAAVALLTIPSALLALAWRRWIHPPADPAWLCWSVPAGILTTIVLLLVDNFSNTVLSFGIAGTKGVWRALYLVASIAVFARIWHRLQHLDPPTSGLRYGGLGAAGLLAVAGLAAVLSEPDRRVGMSARADGDSLRRPNLIWIGSDGVSAELLSAYGNEHETSPFLRELAAEDSALFFENAFVNAADTGGSLLSMLSSKSTATMRAIAHPDVLRGRHRWEHLPAALKDLGYRNLALSIRYFADPVDFNLQNGFDVSNYRRGRREHLRLPLGPAATLLEQRISDRVSERILHIFFILPMFDYHTVVAKQDRPHSLELAEDEKRKLTAFREFIESSDEPFFAFIHGLRTHGPTYEVDRQIFSRGMTQSEKNMKPFLFDAVREFDDFLRAIVGIVVDAGRFDDTVVVFSSDHAPDWKTTQRVPLIIRLPPGVKGGRSRKSVQLIDVAPTLLDYIGAPIPSWMEGSSLLDMEAYEERPIIALAAAGRTSVLFGSVTVVNCGRWYGRKIRRHDLHVPWTDGGSTWHDNQSDFAIRTGLVRGYTGACDSRLTPMEVERIVEDHFRERSYR